MSFSAFFDSKLLKLAEISAVHFAGVRYSARCAIYRRAGILSVLFGGCVALRILRFADNREPFSLDLQSEISYPRAGGAFSAREIADITPVRRLALRRLRSLFLKRQICVFRAKSRPLPQGISSFFNIFCFFRLLYLIFLIMLIFCTYLCAIIGW